MLLDKNLRVEQRRKKKVSFVYRQHSEAARKSLHEFYRDPEWLWIAGDDCQ